MQVEIVKILQGDYTNFYTAKIVGEDLSLFENFISENKNKHQKELENIRNRIKVMAHNTGARETFFKTKEGVPGDGVCALYDEEEKNLRLYCVRYGKLVVVLGGGGEKPKTIRALQENKKLKDENDLVKRISKGISKAMKDKYLQWSADGMELECDDDEIIIEI
ncbi:MAG: hypothetical protein IM600_16835 [Bacteroidetes bacterium]|nr:hypothetical protein [Bacteroidota bacterium]MCA6445097.1 hypothetical protein [Bacteroidota bacterium]